MYMCLRPCSMKRVLTLHKQALVLSVCSISLLKTLLKTLQYNSIKSPSNYFFPAIYHLSFIELILIFMYICLRPCSMKKVLTLHKQALVLSVCSISLLKILLKTLQYNNIKSPSNYFFPSIHHLSFIELILIFMYMCLRPCCMKRVLILHKQALV